MAEDKVDFSTREVVAMKFLEQLEACKTQEGKKQLLMKLLEYTDPMFVLALDFAYGMTPHQKRSQEPT